MRLSFFSLLRRTRLASVSRLGYGGLRATCYIKTLSKNRVRNCAEMTCLRATAGCGLLRRYINAFESGAGVYCSDNRANFAHLFNRSRVVSWGES
jgi:hypothetical protein